MLDKFFVYFMIALVFLILGYAGRMHREAKIQQWYQSKAEKDLAELETEFREAIERPRAFRVFNGQFKVYPVKSATKVNY